MPAEGERDYEALEESEQRFRSLARFAPVGIFLTDAAGNCLFVNERWCELAGLTPVEARGEGWARALHPDDWERVLAEWHEASAAGRESAVEYRFRTPEGKVSWLSGRAVARRDAVGQVVEYVGTVTDISEQTRAARRLAAEHAVTRILSAAMTFQEAAPRLLEALCECVECRVGGIWQVDEHGQTQAPPPGPVPRAGARLRCHAFWSSGQTEAIQQFQAACGDMAFAPGVGLPGRVWRERKAVTIRDVPSHQNLPRLQLAQAANLQGAMAFPLMAGEEFFGVIEFFTEGPLEPEPALLEMMTAIGEDIGQFIRRRRAEAALAAEREARSLLAAIVESSDVAIFSKDLDGIVTSWNRAAERLYGYPAAEMIGKPIARLIPPDRVEEVSALMGRLQQGERVELYETERIRKDGAQIDVLVSLSPIRSRGGRIIGASVLARDITQTKRMADALRESEARYRHLFESSREVMNTVAEGLYTVDAQGLVTYVNPAAEALFGWTSAELVGRKMHDVTHYLHPDGTHFPAEECAGLQVLQTGVVLKEYEDVFIRKDGSFFPVVYSAAPLTESSKFIGLVVSFRDDTARRRLEEEQRAVMAGARCLLWYAEVRDTGNEDLHWDLRPVNEEAAQHFFPVEIPSGQTYAAAWSLSRLPEDKAWMDPNANRLVREGRSYTQDFRCRNLHGEVRWLHEDVRIETLAPLEGTRRWRAVGVTTDITDRKLAEEALQEAVRRKDEFLAMLAHELRNPLAPIRNALHLLRLQAGDAAAVDRWRDTMERQVKHLTRLVDDLLDVSRISRGRVSLQRECLDLTRLVQHTVEDHRAAVEAADLSLEVHLPEMPVWVMADPTRLTQVLDNLLENARKFTNPSGRIDLAIEVDGNKLMVDGQAEPPTINHQPSTINHQPTAVIRVRDTGIGIELEMLPYLFDVFAQADRSLDRSRGGLGLGLALVKGLMELHGGSVEARSGGAGKGAEFVLRLPLLKDEGRRMKEEGSEPDSLPPSAFRLPPSKRVLVIEDSRDAAETLQEILETCGHQVSVAYSGRSGLEVAQAEEPDVILCDIGLPGMDGYQVARALRQMPRFAATRLIAVTGYGQEGDVERSRSAGFNEHLVKPVDPDRLLKALQPPG